MPLEISEDWTSGVFCNPRSSSSAYSSHVSILWIILFCSSIYLIFFLNPNIHYLTILLPSYQTNTQILRKTLPHTRWTFDLLRRECLLNLDRSGERSQTISIQVFKTGTCTILLVFIHIIFCHGHRKDCNQNELEYVVRVRIAQ